MGARRALVVAASEFPRLGRLAYALRRAEAVAAALRSQDFEVQLLVGPHVTGAQIGAAVLAAMAALGHDDVLVVHVLSHGVEVNQQVFVVGTDEQPVATAKVERWLEELTLRPGRSPLTLFLLDFCSSGLAARLPWQSHLDVGALRGWVIAASDPGEAAFDGRLSQALATALSAVRDREFDVVDSLEYVPLPAFTRRIRQELQTLVGSGYGQRLTVNQVEFDAELDLPFFRNPRYRRPVGGPAPRDFQAALRPFLEEIGEGWDTRHFIERASGGTWVRGLPVEEMVGCFTGRAEELRLLSPWLTGEAGGHRLGVVTGSPGVGKSALLGLLICAAHPDLREPTRALWDVRNRRVPNQVPGLLAVHARARSLTDVLSSVTEQAGVSTASASEVVAALRQRPDHWVLVLDALDESDDPRGLVEQLLLPLSAPDGPGSPVRVLVGVRPYPLFDDLLGAAQRSGQLIDLDAVEPGQLTQDLEDYVRGLIRANPDVVLRGDLVGGFSDAVARALVQVERDRSPDEQRWGPFLVAGLYTRYILRTRLDQLRLNSDRAVELGEHAPRTLSQVLRLDIEAQPDVPLGPLLLTLAQARGEGMPLTVIQRLLPGFATGGSAPDLSDVRTALDRGRFYVRQAVDEDGTVLYRLFHQGLTDDLRPIPNPFFDPALRRETTQEFRARGVETLLRPLGRPDNRDWKAAEPYLLRHVHEHVTDEVAIVDLLRDSEYLLRRQSVLSDLGPDLIETNPVLRDALEVVRSSGQLTPFDLALILARHRRAGLAPAPSHADDPAWVPVWAQGPASAPGFPPQVPEAPAAAPEYSVSAPEVAVPVVRPPDARIVALHLARPGAMISLDAAGVARMHVIESAHRPRRSKPGGAVIIGRNVVAANVSEYGNAAVLAYGDGRVDVLSGRRVLWSCLRGPRPVSAVSVSTNGRRVFCVVDGRLELHRGQGLYDGRASRFWKWVTRGRRTSVWVREPRDTWLGAVSLAAPKSDDVGGWPPVLVTTVGSGKVALWFGRRLIRFVVQREPIDPALRPLTAIDLAGRVSAISVDGQSLEVLLHAGSRDLLRVVADRQGHADVVTALAVFLHTVLVGTSSGVVESWEVVGLSPDGGGPRVVARTHTKVAESAVLAVAIGFKAVVAATADGGLHLVQDGVVSDLPWRDTPLSPAPRHEDPPPVDSPVPRPTETPSVAGEAVRIVAVPPTNAGLVLIGDQNGVVRSVEVGSGKVQGQHEIGAPISARGRTELRIVAGLATLLVRDGDRAWMLGPDGWTEADHWVGTPTHEGELLLGGQLVAVARDGRRIVSPQPGFRAPLVIDGESHSAQVTCLATRCVGGRWYLVSGDQAGVVVFRALTDGVTDRIEVGRPVEQVEYTPDGTLVVVAGGEAIALRRSG